MTRKFIISFNNLMKLFNVFSVSMLIWGCWNPTWGLTSEFYWNPELPNYRTCWTSTGTEHSITFKLKEKVKVDQVIVIGKADSSLLMNSVRVSRTIFVFSVCTYEKGWLFQSCQWNPSPDTHWRVPVWQYNLNSNRVYTVGFLLSGDLHWWNSGV